MVFETPTTECRARNRARNKIVPERVLAQQARQVKAQRDALDREFDVVLAPTVVRRAPAHIARSAPLVAAQAAAPVGLRFGLQIPSFSWPGGAAELRGRLRAIASAAEDAGFDSIWVMDHFRQIPMFGPAWHDMLESYTTLAYLAAVTERMRLGTLVTGVTYRNVGAPREDHRDARRVERGPGDVRPRARMVRGRARSVRMAVPVRRRALRPSRRRAAGAADAVGQGHARRSRAACCSVPDTTCYPRPLQEHVPDARRRQRRTAHAATRRAVRRCVQHDRRGRGRRPQGRRVARALRRASTAIAPRSRSRNSPRRSSAATAVEVDALVERLRPRRQGAERYAASVNAGTVTDHVGRFRALADAGVQTAIVSFPDLADPDPVERFAPVVAAFR